MACKPPAKKPPEIAPVMAATAVTPPAGKESMLRLLLDELLPLSCRALVVTDDDDNEACV